MCSAPLDVVVTMPSDRLRAFYTYCEFKPMKFNANTSFKKIIGLNQRRLCFGCYRHAYLKLVPGPRELMGRETSTKKQNLMITYPVTHTRDEIYEWFKGFDEFFSRPNLEDYLMERCRFSTPGLIVITQARVEPYLFLAQWS